MQFIKFTLASILGLCLFFVLLVLILVGIGTLQDKEVVEVKEKSVLKLNLNVPISEMSKTSPFEDLGLPEVASSASTIGLIDILKAIKAAKTDEKIKGIYIEVSMPQAGYAVLHEVREALADFKQSGKFVYAYSEVYTEGAYYVASVADKIMLNPAGGIEFNGLIVEKMYLTGMLEKIGVKPEIFKVGDFKSAVEPLMSKQMSEADRLQTSTYLNSVYDFYLSNVAQSRNIPLEDLRKISKEMLVRNVGDALKYQLITDSVYYDQVTDLLKKATGTDEKDEKAKINFISVKKYVKSDFVVKQNLAKDSRVAVIVAEGDIVSGKGDDESIGSDKIAEEIRKARKDSKIKAIVLRINSPGGSALASDVMWREVQLAKAEKPIIASMSAVAASGGYYMAMGCDTIVAQPNTITGSIGIFGVLVNAENLLTEKMGLTFDRVATGDYSGLGYPTRAMSDAEKQIIQRGIEEGYERFTSKAAAGRRMHIDSLKKIASGRVWTGATAQKIGLVDVLGGLDVAIQLAAKKANLKEGEYSVKYMPQQKSFIDRLMDVGEKEVRERNIKSELGIWYPYYKQLKRLQTYEGVQARLPFELVIK
jgi:protease-4